MNEENKEEDFLNYPVSLEDFDNDKYSEIYEIACNYEQYYELTDTISKRLILKFLETKQPKYLDHLSHVAKHATGDRDAECILSHILEYVRDQILSSSLWLKLKDLVHSLEYLDSEDYEIEIIQAKALEEKIGEKEFGRIIVFNTNWEYDSPKGFLKTTYVIRED